MAIPAHPLETVSDLIESERTRAAKQGLALETVELGDDELADLYEWADAGSEPLVRNARSAQTPFYLKGIQYVPIRRQHGLNLIFCQTG